ncbi:MAG: hypothetical protein H6727_02230 [Myxococcales bacterium]|nr:hypothetical protein [Myxococcales bacterium]
MSDYKIRFRDQQTGRQVEVEADRMKQSWWKGSVEENFDKSKVGDGVVDVMVSEDKWSWDRHSHLGVKTDGLSSDDAAALKRALEDPRAAKLSVFDAQSGLEMSGLRVIKTDAAGELSATTPNLDPTGARRPVQLTPSGQVATPDGREPQGMKEVGDGLFRMASLIDDVKGNLFDEIQASGTLKEKMLGNLSETLSAAAPGKSVDGLDQTQTLQLRSSSATTLLELMTSKHNISNDLKSRAFDVYEKALSNETNPLLKDSMVMNLDRLKGSLPSALRDRAEGLVEASNVTKPPYDKWFANGNNTVNIDMSNGAGEGFLEDNVKYFESIGFKRVGGTDSAPILEKTYEKNGVETNFRMNFRTNRNDMFKEVGQEDTHIVIYSGHSGWGRNVRDSLQGAPKASGEGQLIMTNLCVGKGELQQMKDKFPDAQVITTYNSEYFQQGGTAESHFAMKELFEGIAERRGYEGIAEDVRTANPWSSSHRREEGIDNNFIFPTDLKVRRQHLDLDHDGQADVFDRMVNFNTFDVKTDTAREFQAIQPSRSSDELVGTKIHFAAMSTNRISIYNELLEHRNGTAEVVPAGYHDAEPGETGMFRFTKNAAEGTVEMSMDSRFAHMSEEALRMASAYEYALYKGQSDTSWPLKGADDKLHALVFAAQSLNTDSGYRDSAVWGEFLKAYNLPNISLSTVKPTIEADEHYYSGSRASVNALRGKLDASMVEQLGQSSVGVIQVD